MSYGHRRRQPIIKGVTRERVGAGVLKEIDAEVRRLSRMYGVSRSWVISTVLADAFKIKKQPRYYLAEVPVKRRRHA